MKYVRCKQGGVIVRKHGRQFKFTGGVCVIPEDYLEIVLKNDLFEEITEEEYDKVKNSVPKKTEDEEEKPKVRKRGSKAFMKLEED